MPEKLVFMHKRLKGRFAIMAFMSEDIENNGESAERKDEVFPVTDKQKRDVIDLLENSYLNRKDVDDGCIKIGNDNFSAVIIKASEDKPLTEIRNGVEIKITKGYSVGYGPSIGLYTEVLIKQDESGEWKLKKYKFDVPDETTIIDPALEFQDEAGISECNHGDAEELINVLKSNEGRPTK